MTQHSSPVAVTPVSPLPTSLQPPSEDQQSFVTLTPPLAFSVDGEEYLLSLAEDEGITDLFSSVDLGDFPLDMPPLWKAILEIFGGSDKRDANGYIGYFMTFFYICICVSWKMWLGFTDAQVCGGGCFLETSHCRVIGIANLKEILSEI